MPQKLNRREAQLVRHARERAVAEYKAATRFRLEVPRTDDKGTLLLIVDLALDQLEALNKITGEPVFFYSLVSHWRV